LSIDGAGFVAEPVVKERKRNQEGSNKFLESLGIDLSNVRVVVSLKPEDKEMIQSTLKEISDKVDYRWKVTQGIMIVALLLSAGAQVVNWSQ
tara:strand:+ start:263 stop:538 length:276 start_codon:yes stop_codon:yes gene_type:complete